MSIETKHTPGPWYAVEYGGYMSIQNVPHYTLVNLLDKSSCLAAEYNAKLAATSPEMLQQHVQDIEHLQGVMELVDSEVKTILAAMVEKKQALVQKATTIQ